MKALVRSILPKSILGQIMLVVALGLLLGHIASAALLLRAADQRRIEAVSHALAYRLIVAQLDRRDDGVRNRQNQPMRGAASGRFAGQPLRRALRIPIERSTGSPQLKGEPRLARYESALRETLDEQGIAVKAIAVTRRKAVSDRFVAEHLHMRPRWRTGRFAQRDIIVAGIARADGTWDVLRVPEPRRPQGVIGRILFESLLLFSILFVLLYLSLRRITRPLTMLTRRMETFAQHPESAIRLEESGPRDVRQLIAAHNAMEQRITALLDEKDVMLGAIGHDLKTPLAALRVRIENIPDEASRAPMAATINELNRTLDDILSLARVGRASEPPEKTDLGALVAALVDDYEEMGKPIELAETGRIIAPIQVTWLRRALRNLIGNALRYGQRARLSVSSEDGCALIRIEDEGPGIPEDQIAAMFEPFARGETSRNRQTGGTGLGLTIARAIIAQHGGALRLANRMSNDGTRCGLIAEIRLPLGD